LRKWPAKAACHATVINHFPGKGRSRPHRKAVIHRFVS
jgi:hypothetical protein